MEIKELNHDDILKMLPDRRNESHKGDYGKLLFICGSRGYTGAAALSALGALRSGAGLVYLAVPESIYEIEATKLLEPVVFPVPDRDGMLAESAVEILKDYIAKVDVILIGPGIGQSDDVTKVVLWTIENYQGPVILDADGINALAQHKDILRDRTAPTILTPHDGEFKRMGGTIKENRLDSAAQLASELGVIVLLKGHRTVITDNVSTYVNNTGNPGMAVGGSGDILAGIIAALIGQGLAPLEAAACGAWLHGASGDICSTEIGQYGMLPSDMLTVLPRLLK